jgi:hypothetical protein
MTTDVGVPGGGRAGTQLSASLSEGTLRRSNALDPPLAAILRRRRDASWTCASTDRTKVF